ELLRSFGQAVLMDAHQRCRVVRHHGHPRLHDRPAMALVGEARPSAAKQAGNNPFDPRAAVATSTGKTYLSWGPGARQARRGQDLPNLLGRWRRGERLARVGDAHGENPPGM